ncbi:hypothetical protein [uncultured Tenacibaculum sp.]|uniref:hypothetical protein n=1 Tax=uncultured Tenacibaculum sp. TaxID=174713 RepID=UPI0026337BDA|nr:hypothetical protein [uncultured Tenacibaculum sp.]
MSIALASQEDIKDIMSFIDSEWKEGHILSRDQNFFLYEHREKDRINFVISRNLENKIDGVLGFIPSALGEVSDVCTVIWKVSKSSTTQNPILGIQLLQFLETQKIVRNVLSLGINQKTIGIYKYLNMYTNSLDQFVIINKNIKDFKIAKINNLDDRLLVNKLVSLKENYVVNRVKNDVELSSFEFEKYRECIPYKNKEYFYKRYFEHPIYEYQIYGAYSNESIVSLIVTRVQTCNNSKVLRIVDFLGEEKCLPNYGRFFSDLIEEKNYEYADFYCFGLEKEKMIEAGFQLVDCSSEDLIIPNYFSPFLQKNVQMHFFTNANEIKSLKLFKANGDQDRPN